MSQKNWPLGFVLCAVALATPMASTAAIGAQRVELRGQLQQPSLAFPPSIAANDAPEKMGTEITPSLGLDTDGSLSLKRESGAGTSFQNLHFEQIFRGVPIWGDRVVVSRNRSTNSIQRLGGSIVRGIAADISNPTPAVSAEAALQKAKDVVRLGMEKKGIAAASNNPVFSDERARLVVYVRPADRAAKLSYEVSFFAVRNEETGEATRPVFLIDAVTAETLYYYDGLTFADGTGPGGNQKTQQYFYGTGKRFPSFQVTEVGNGQCLLSNSLVDTEDLNESADDIKAPFKYQCYDNTNKAINGGYAPMNDASYFGALIHKMWTDWYGEPPVSQKLVMRVHYSKNYENAFWNGRAMYFGDGMNTFYPLVALDVTSHEIAHGYTEQHSGLIYDGQSGAINEAFSDMAGQAAEYYQSVITNPSSPSEPDFLIGKSIMKQQRALRDMCNPPSIGNSIGSAKNYYDGLDMHLGSGVYNKAFCTLAKSSGWDTRKAFQVFQVANRDFWTPLTNFQNGAEGVRDAAKALGYSVDDIVRAFAVVDIVLTP